MPRVFARQLAAHGHCLALAQVEIGNGFFGNMHLAPHVRNGLQHHARNMQVGAIGTSAANEGVDGDLLQRGQVAKCDRPVEEGEGCGATRGPQGAIFMVGGGVVPGAEARWRWAGEGAGGVVGVVEGKEVGGEGGAVGLFEAGDGERAGDKQAGGGIGGAGGLVRVKGPAVVFWGAEFVAMRRELAARGSILVVERQIGSL